LASLGFHVDPELLAFLVEMTAIGAERAAGQHADAARALGLHPNNLHRLIRHLGLRGTRKA
jgi:transcriptional regulator with GAF, ATPase, and Fis domain